MNTKVFRNLSYGVYVISSLDGERPTGCIANSVMQITSSPATIALSMNHDNYTNSCIAASGKFAVSILSEESDPGLIGNFGFQSGKDVNKFDAADYRMESGLPIVTEIMSPRYCEIFENTVDLVQIGARNMQNFDLLKEVGKMSKPVLLKRGLANTYEEWIMSAEYIMSEGNENVILCERGIRTFETYTRNTLDVSAIPCLRRMTHLPIIVDPSHSGGAAWLVEPLTMAAIAAGADGIIVEVHNDPPHAKCDGKQSLTPKQFDDLMKKATTLAQFMGKTV